MRLRQSRNGRPELQSLGAFGAYWGSPVLGPLSSGGNIQFSISISCTKEKIMGVLKTTAAVACGLLVGGGAVQLLHAKSKPPAFVVSEIAVRDQKGYDENFLKATQKDIASHGGKYLAGGLDKTVSLVGNPPPNRVVILQFPNMDAVKAWRDEGAMDMENTVGNKYAAFRIYAVDGVTP